MSINSIEWSPEQTERKYVVFIIPVSLPPYKREYFWYPKAKESVEIEGQKAMLFSGADFRFFELNRKMGGRSVFDYQTWIYEDISNIENYKRLEPMPAPISDEINDEPYFDFTTPKQFTSLGALEKWLRE